jgi:uncharacterized protein YjbI with pentapeptide repeats
MLFHDHNYEEVVVSELPIQEILYSSQQKENSLIVHNWMDMYRNMFGYDPEHIYNVDFKELRMNHAVFSKTVFYKVRFQSNNMYSVLFRDCMFIECNFSSCNDYQDMAILNSQFEDCDVNGCFNTAVLKRVQFRNCRMKFFEL